VVKHTEEKNPAAYFYARDHLGSSSVLTTQTGSYHERIEYLPYGETWVEDKATSDSYTTPYKFTGKELDTETGLYYFGARYYDAKISRWISTDPALEKYFPKPNDYDTEHDFYWYLQQDGSKKLAGLGGVFNAVNMDVYHYAGNNPVKLVDPDGRITIVSLMGQIKQFNKMIEINFNESKIKQYEISDGGTACFYRSLQSIAESYAGKNLTMGQIEEATKDLIKSGDMEANYYVLDPVAVIKDTLSRLGVNTEKIDIIFKKDVKNISKEATATIRGVPSSERDLGHFQHGDNKGNLVWDPWTGTNDTGKPVSRIDEVIIRKKEEK
jgi:RHS repeat-associated protein